MARKRLVAGGEWRWLVVLLAVAFALKLAVLLQLKDHPLLQTNAGLDTTTYAALAERVASGDVLLGPGVYFVSPLYIYFCALIVALGGSFVAVRVVQITLGTAAVYFVYVAAREWFGDRAAWWAAVLTVLTGTFTFYEVLVIQAALDPFLIAASIACLALALTRDRTRWWVLAGACFGLATLNRPNVLPAAVAMAAAAIVTRGKERGARGEERGARGEERGARREERGARREERGARGEERGARSEERGARSEEGGARGEGRAARSEERGARRDRRGARSETRRARSETRRARSGAGRRAAWLALGLILFLAPVSIRNGVVAGDWSPLPSQGGLNFYIGNNPAANGTYRPVPGIRPTIEGQQSDARDVASHALSRPVSDREASSYFYRQGFDWIRSEPARSAALFARKLALLFNRAHVFLNYSYPFFTYDARTLLMALPVGAWLLIPLGVAGLIARGARRETRGAKDAGRGAKSEGRRSRREGRGAKVRSDERGARRDAKDAEARREARGATSAARGATRDAEDAQRAENSISADSASSAFRLPPRASLLAFTTVYALTTAAFFVSDRYRLPLLIPMAIAAGSAIDGIIGPVFRPGGWRDAGSKDPAYIRGKDQAPSARSSRLDSRASLLAAVLFIFVNWPLRADDGRPEERARMAERLIQLGDYAEAGRWAALAEKGYPRAAVLHVRIGTQFLQAREPRLALEQFERAAALEPDEAEVQYRLGQALLEAGRPGDAVAHLRVARARNPLLPLVGYDLARALASTGDRGGALAALGSAQPAAESRAQNFVAFGDLAMQLHDAGIAEAFFRRAVAAAPALAAAHQQLGLALGIENRLPEASEELSAAARLNPGDATTHLNLAVVHAQAGRYSDARAEAEEALRLSPSYLQARQLLAALPPIRH